jgi:hypothetical protein
LVLLKLTGRLVELLAVAGNAAADDVVAGIGALSGKCGAVVEGALAGFQGYAAVEAMRWFAGQLNCADHAVGPKATGLGVHRPGDANESALLPGLH